MSSSVFQLDPRLARDTHPIADLPLCEVRLMDNKHFPWVVLVPRVANAQEWIDLSREAQHQLSDEIAIISHLLQALVTPEKLNIATLGNQVSQLHVHVMGRYRHDIAWPNPVFGSASAPYRGGEAEQFIYDLRTAIDALQQ